MTDSVLFLNIRRSPLENNAAVYAARDLGLNIVLMAASTPRAAGRFAEVWNGDTFDLTESRRAARDLARRHNIVGVVSWSDRDVELAALIAHDLRLPGTPVASARVVRDKKLMRAGLGEDPALVPRNMVVREPSELQAAIDGVGFPAILKPISGSASRGIFDAHDVASAHKSYQALQTYLATERDPGVLRAKGVVLFEERLDGTEHSVEGFVSQGEVLVAGITDKWATTPYYLEYQQIHSSTLPAPWQAVLRDFAVEVVTRLGLDNCAFHLEAIVDGQGRPRLLEVAGRIAGNYITSHLVPLSSGLPFYRNVIRTATGLRPSMVRDRNIYAGMRYVLAERAGKVRSVRGLEAALDVPGVEHIAWESGPSVDVALPPADFMSPVLASVIATHTDRESLEETLKTAVGLCEPEYG